MTPKEELERATHAYLVAVEAEKASLEALTVALVATARHKVGDTVRIHAGHGQYTHVGKLGTVIEVETMSAWMGSGYVVGYRVALHRSDGTQGQSIIVREPCVEAVEP